LQNEGTKLFIVEEEIHACCFLQNVQILARHKIETKMG